MTARSPLRSFLAKGRAFLVRDLLIETSYKLQSAFRLLSVVLQILTFYFLAKFVSGDLSERHLARYGGDYFTFALVGVAFTGLFNAGLIAYTTTIRQQMMTGVFESMAATPTGSVSLLLFTLIWPLGFELVKIVLYLTVGVFFLGARIDLERWPLVLVSAGLSLFVFGALGLLAGSLILYFKRGDPVAWFLTAATQLVGGVIIPVTLLPDWLQVIAYAIPVPFALDALRVSLIPSAQTSGVGRDLLVLAGFAVVLLPLAIVTARRVMASVRGQGSLGLH